MEVLILQQYDHFSLISVVLTISVSSPKIILDEHDPDGKGRRLQPSRDLTGIPGHKKLSEFHNDTNGMCDWNNLNRIGTQAGDSA